MNAIVAEFEKHGTRRVATVDAAVGLGAHKGGKTHGLGEEDDINAGQHLVVRVAVALAGVDQRHAGETTR